MMLDANGAVVGRLGARVAKALLNGESVVIVNAEKSVISGSRTDITSKYVARRAVIQKANPEHAPHWPRRPDMLLRRIIRGMLPFEKPTGKMAYKRLRVYIGVPEEMKDAKFEQVGIKEMRSKFMVLDELCKELGWNG